MAEECHCWLLPHTSLTKAFTSGERGERDSLLWELASLFTDPGGGGGAGWSAEALGSLECE